MTRSLAYVLWFFLMLAILGCGGGNTPVNKGQDMPVPPKKDAKDK